MKDFKNNKTKINDNLIKYKQEIWKWIQKSRKPKMGVSNILYKYLLLRNIDDLCEIHDTVHVRIMCHVRSVRSTGFTSITFTQPPSASNPFILVPIFSLIPITASYTYSIILSYNTKKPRMKRYRLRSIKKKNVFLINHLRRQQNPNRIDTSRRINNELFRRLIIHAIGRDLSKQRDPLT